MTEDIIVGALSGLCAFYAGYRTGRRAERAHRAAVEFEAMRQRGEEMRARVQERLNEARAAMPKRSFKI